MSRALRPPPAPRGATPAPLFLGLRHGLGALIDTLRQDLAGRGTKVVLNGAVTSLGRSADNERWLLETTRDSFEAEAVVLAIPAREAAVLLAGAAPELAVECAAIPYAGVVTVTLAWPEAAIPATTAAALRTIVTARAPGAGAAVLPGSGVLIPRGRGQLITAASFTSSKWPHSARAGEVVIRASAGRHGDERALALDDAGLVAAVRADLTAVLGIVAAPLETKVVRFPASFPQYVSGHLARASRIMELASRHRGLALCGAAYHGIGIPACIESGARAASAIVGAGGD